jgi:diguanylate cyclase (GGDEF)-like protein/PAS domain S-box-containing protein
VGGIPLRVVLVSGERAVESIETILTNGGYTPYLIRVESRDDLINTLNTGVWDVVLAGGQDALLTEDEVRVAVATASETIAVLSVSPRAVPHDLPAQVREALAQAQELWRRHQREIAMADTEAQFRALFEYAAVGLNIGDSRGRCIISNPAFQRMLGYSDGELRGIRFADITAPEDLSQDREMYGRLRAGEMESYRIEKRYVAKDGRRIWTRATISLVPDANGEPQYDVGLVEDISEARETAAALHAAQALNADLIANVQEGIILLDTDLRLLVWNRYMEAHTGLATTEVLGRPLVDVLPGMVANRSIQLVERALRGETVQSDDILYTIQRTGKQGWAVLTFAPHRAPGGKTAGVVGLFSNISRRRQAEDELRRGLDLLRAVTEATPDAIFLKDLDGRYQMINTAGATILGRAVTDVLGSTDDDLFLSASAADIRLSDQQVTATRATASIEETRYIGEQRIRLMTTKSPLIDESGDVVGVVGISKDVTERHSAAEALVRSEERYRTLVEASLDGILTLDPAGTITFANRQMGLLLGHRDAGELAGQSFGRYILTSEHVRGAELFALTLAEGRQLDLQFTLQRVDGTTFSAEMNAFVVFDAEGKPSAITVVARDVTERKAYQDQLKFQAMHDALTGLPNRTLFGDRLSQALLAARRSSESVGVLLLDLDRFKEVNDTLGHHHGDLVLQQIGRRFLDTLRESDTVARLGGDEFAIVLAGADEPGAIASALKILDSLAVPFRLEGQDYYLSASIGIVMFPSHGDDIATLLRRADVAMYGAKRSSAGYSVYSPETDPNSQERLSISSGLRGAIEQGQLVLRYQPKIHLDRSCADHVEALVRWQHPEHGLIPPDQFIPLAEQTGLISSLTRWVVREAVRQARAWRNEGLDIEIAVNFSTRNLHDPEMVGFVRDTLIEHNIAPAQLLVEITESSLMSEPARAHQTVKGLRELGVHVAVDDFGTGYSSLSYLHQLHVDEIKIDRSFVRRLTEDDEGASIIVRSVIDLGHNLGLLVVAEGVETEETFTRLLEWHCDIAQGYHVARPMSPDEFSSWWHHWFAGTGRNL